MTDQNRSHQMKFIFEVRGINLALRKTITVNHLIELGQTNLLYNGEIG